LGNLSLVYPSDMVGHRINTLGTLLDTMLRAIPHCVTLSVTLTKISRKTGFTLRSIHVAWRISVIQRNAQRAPGGPVERCVGIALVPRVRHNMTHSHTHIHTNIHTYMFTNIHTSAHITRSNMNICTQPTHTMKNH
jgi:hypothetical protein